MRVLIPCGAEHVAMDEAMVQGMASGQTGSHECQMAKCRGLWRAAYSSCRSIEWEGVHK
jgi:hypothetical protein